MVQWLLYSTVADVLQTINGTILLLLYGAVAAVVLEAINDTVAAVWYSNCCASDNQWYSCCCMLQWVL